MDPEPEQINPAVLAAVVSAGVAIVVSLISAWVSFWVQKDRLRNELKLEFATESAIRDLLSTPQWTQRSFEEIEKRLQGFEKNELRKLLIRSGAVSFKGRDGKEL